MQSLLPGTEVLARSLRWEVVSAEQLGEQTLFRLRGTGGALLGRELDLLHPFEPVEPVRHDFAPERAAPLQHWWLYHQAFLLDQALGPSAILAAHPGRLTVEPYQLVPVLRALQMSRVRLLLADGVGLGKTVQAGLILTELLARRMAHRILIVAPAGPLLEQWRSEMADRFGLRLDVADRARLEEIRRGEELGANPFDRLSLAIASPDFLKQERVLELLERSAYDVVILDEAHHYFDLAGLGEREDSQRRRLAEVLARKCDSLLLLTATPHDGNDTSFASLCELLDPSLVDGNGTLRGERYRRHVVRRLKRHIPGRFRERIVKPCAVVASSSEHPGYIELQRRLLELVAPQLKRAYRERRFSEVLSYISLLKRSVSTVFACKETLSVVAERYQRALSFGAEEQDAKRQRLRTLRDYQRKMERFGTLSASDELDQADLEAEDLAQLLADAQRDVRSGSTRLARVAGVTEALDELVDLAASALTQDPKLHRLVAEVKSIRAAEPGANVLIYTEYVDSQRAAIAALKEARLGEVLAIRGGSADAGDDEKQLDRALVTDRFQSEDNLILVSTDAAAEGLNLHQHCHQLIHLELPFNPNRLEQRNGRIDRYGQTKDPIVRYLYLGDTFEERILFRLIAKYERQRRRLTFVPNTLGVTLSTDPAAERLLKPFMEEETLLFTQGSKLLDVDDAAEGPVEQEATRELLAEIDRSLRGFEKAAVTASWLGESGLNSEARLTEEAARAADLGQRAGAVDLLRFVQDAVRVDGGDWQQTEPDVFEFQLPPTWRHGLAELPGFQPQAGRLLLTTDRERLRDSNNRPVGYLGRAHPVVQRALDRVRSQSLGASRGEMDARVSAVAAEVKTPELLLTFLGRVMSDAGREYERLITVRMDGEGEFHVYESAADWAPFANPARALKPAGLWERHFAGWGTTAADLAQGEARDGFRPLADAFIAERRSSMEKERASLKEWLTSRAREILASSAEPITQPSLFDEPSPVSVTPASTDPIDRLRALAEDRTAHGSAASEARSVLQLFDGRDRALAARLRFREPELVNLGWLMLIPAKGGE